MKILYLLLLSILLQEFVLYAQNDPQAISILDNFSSSALGAPSVSMNFEMITTDLTENTADTSAGSVIVSKNRYKLSFPDNIIWFNGESIWNYLTAEEEVTITRADKKDHSFQNRPSEIFSMYKSGYKCRLVEERSDAYIVDLYPLDTKSDLVRVRLAIGKTKPDLKSLEYKRRDGIMITLHISRYDLKLKPDNDTFIFQPEKYKDVEVIDMR